MTANEATDEIHRHLSDLMQALSAYVEHAGHHDDLTMFTIVKHLTDAERLLTGLGAKDRSVRVKTNATP